MKALLPLFSLIGILSISVLSSMLYLSQYYTSSALLTILWVIGITHWIVARGVKQREAK